MDKKHEKYEKTRHDLRVLLPSLPPLEQDVLSMRFGLKGKYGAPIEAVEKHFNMSKEDVRKIELKTFWNIKKSEKNLVLAHKAYNEGKLVVLCC